MIIEVVVNIPKSQAESNEINIWKLIKYHFWVDNKVVDNKNYVHIYLQSATFMDRKSSKIWLAENFENCRQKNNYKKTFEPYLPIRKFRLLFYQYIIECLHFQILKIIHYMITKDR